MIVNSNRQLVYYYTDGNNIPQQYTVPGITIQRDTSYNLFMDFTKLGNITVAYEPPIYRISTDTVDVPAIKSVITSNTSVDLQSLQLTNLSTSALEYVPPAPPIPVGNFTGDITITGVNLLTEIASSFLTVLEKQIKEKLITDISINSISDIDIVFNTSIIKINIYLHDTQNSDLIISYTEYFIALDDDGLKINQSLINLISVLIKSNVIFINKF